MDRSSIYILLSIFLVLFTVWMCTQQLAPVNWAPPFYNQLSHDKNNSNNNENNESYLKRLKNSRGYDEKI